MIETAVAVDDLLCRLAAMDPRLLTDEQKLHLGEINERILARAHAHSAKTLVEIDASGATVHVLGVRTTTWMRERHGYAANHAAGVLREAIRTVNAPPVWQALTDATISPRQASAILDALKHLPPDLPPDKESAAQHTMVDQAHRLDPAELAVVGNRLVEMIDPAHTDALLEHRLEQEERAARRNRELHLRPDGMGSTLIKGRVPAAEGEKLAALLDSLVDQHTNDEPPLCGSYCTGPSCGLCGGHPSRAMRRADALMEIAQAYADESMPRRMARTGPECSHRRPRDLAPRHRLRRHQRRSDVRATTAAAGLRRRDHPHGSERLRCPARCGSIASILRGRAACRSGRPRRRLHLSRLRPAGPALRRPPHHLVVCWRIDHPRQRCPALPVPQRPGRTLAPAAAQREPLGGSPQPHRPTTGVPATTGPGQEPPPPAPSPPPAPNHSLRSRRRTLTLTRARSGRSPTRCRPDLPRGLAWSRGSHRDTGSPIGPGRLGPDARGRRAVHLDTAAIAPLRCAWPPTR